MIYTQLLRFQQLVQRTIILGICLLYSTFFFAQNAILTGRMLDGATKEGLGFVTVMVVGKNVGDVADADGRYRITNIPAGEQLVRVSYTGYETQERTLTFEEGQTMTLDFTLGEVSIVGQEVIISAQALGQRAAINEQINSNTIVNVVSKDRLREIPDQNAAESVGRLSGVSLQRDGGEGQKVIVRGLSPRFNSITINGERLPSTSETDRSVDLAMISPDMLSGIELFKALRPDMDGDAVGGTINFTVRKAEDGKKASVRLMGGYNGLTQNPLMGRGNVDFSDRFMKGKMGLVATANYQLADRSTEFLSSGYTYDGDRPDGSAILLVGDLSIGDQKETRTRYGGSLTYDFIPNANNDFFVSYNYGFTSRDQFRIRRRFRPLDNTQDYDVRDRRESTSLHAISLNGAHRAGQFEFKWRGSYANSLQDNPYSLSARFRELSATFPNVVKDQGPEKTISGFRNRLNNTFLYDSAEDQNRVEESNATAQLDGKYNLRLGDRVSGYLKAGVKHRRTQRSRDRTQYWVRPYLTSENMALTNPGEFIKGAGSTILMANFLGGEYDNPDFYNGRFDILPGTPGIRDTQFIKIENIDPTAYNSLFGESYQNGDIVKYEGHFDIDKLRRFRDRYNDSYVLNQQFDLEDYTGEENITAGYLMGEFNIGRQWMFLGGLRYEDTRQTYTSVSGQPKDEDEGGTGFLNTVDTRASQGYGELLPMFHLRYKPVPWFDVRLATTRTLSRPNFFSLVPWERINTNELTIDRGRPDLKHTTVWNYDVFTSFYNRFGLLTIGAFYKELENIDYVGTTIINESANPNFKGFTLNSPNNIPVTSKVRGLEFDLQANLKPLSNWLSGWVFYANVTILRSVTAVPEFRIETTFDPITPPFFFTTTIDTFRSIPVPGQADLIGNLALGYEKRGFSGRISVQYQGRALSPGTPGIGSDNSGVGFRRELDSYDDAFVRWDLALKQRINKRWTAVLNVNNITNTPEPSFLGSQRFLQEEAFFGYTIDLGIVYRFDL
jgi:TonB-dependent receptor